MTNEEASNRIRKQDDETNDNNNNQVPSSYPKQGSQTSPKNETSAAHTQPPSAPPIMAFRQVRPARPNLRRQVVVASAAAAGVDGGGHPLMGAPIELASLRGVHPAMIPPKRPSHLPSRYETFARAPPHPLVPSDHAAGAASSKPNRYSTWANQMHSNWLAAPGQRGAAAGEAGGSPPFEHHHFSPAGMLVVNPMRIVNLSEHTKSRLVKIIEALKRFSEQWFSHVLLLMFLALYACFGAYIFISFEAPTEQWEKQLIIDTRQRMVNESWSEAKSKNQQEFVDLFRGKLEDYERLLNRACASGMTSSSLEDQWTFWGALFYSMTVFTTIGYGHLTPITFAGRVATMIYAIFGIPILLMVLADLGKLLTRIIKFAFRQSRSLYKKLLHKKTSIRTRKMISDNTNHCIGAARGAFVRGYAHIQPYNKLPHAFAKVSSFRRRFQHSSANETENQTAEAVVDESTAKQGGDEGDTPTSTTTASAPTDQQATAEVTLVGSDTSDLTASPKRETTDVIVTPAREMKPVSPPINDRKQPFDGPHSSHHSHHHPSYSHHHYHPASHHSRSQSLGIHSTIKRKSSLGNPISTNQKKAVAISAADRGATVSRSSSLLSSLAPQNGDPKLAKKQDSIAMAKNCLKAPKQDVKSFSSEPNADEKAKLDTLGNLDPTETLVAPAVEGFEDEIGPTLEEVIEDDDGIEDEFDIPVSFALFLLVTYMMFGAVVFSIWEGWNFFDSLYFVFISMSTIGFGDLVPQHPKRMIGTFIYLLFGLALTSMCINVVQEKIHATFLRAKMQIGEKMGLDLDQIMADDYYDGSTMECDEDDLNSMAASQTNSSLAACHMCLDGDNPDSENKPVHVDSTCEGVKQSRSRDSLRIKRRGLVTGLPAHSGGSGLRRNHSKRLQRQMTPSSTQGVANAELATPPANSMQTPVAPLPLKSEIETHRMLHQVGNDTTAPAINQPANEVAKGICEPLTGNFLASMSTGGRNKLVASKSQPTAISNSRMPKSLSSEIGFDTHGGASSSPNRRPGTAMGDGQNLQQQPTGRRSADLSRRSSVSQELNQLDDLITKLSHCQSVNERFGPLLGIPSSRRQSRSNPSSTDTINGNGNAMAKRGTSMINRDSRFQGSYPSASDIKIKRASLVGPPPRVVPAPVIKNNLNNNRNNAHQDALEELEAIKFSAV